MNRLRESLDRNAPRRYDDLELGNCSKFEFRKALNELWKAKGLPILPSEVEGWASMFDKKRNGADSEPKMNLNLTSL